MAASPFSRSLTGLAARDHASLTTLYVFETPLTLTLLLATSKLRLRYTTSIQNEDIQVARFYGEVDGGRSCASRTGSKSAGMSGHIRGSNVGARVRCYVNVDGQDVIEVYRTGGSNGNGCDQFVGAFVDGEATILGGCS